MANLGTRIERLLDPSGGISGEVPDDQEVRITAGDLRKLRDVYARVMEERSGVFAAHGSRAGRKLLIRIWMCARQGLHLTPSVEDTRILASLLPEYAPHAVPVPTEITPAMINAWQSAFMAQLRARTGSGRVSSFYKRLKHEPAEVVAYRAMLAARPKAEPSRVELMHNDLQERYPLILGALHEAEKHDEDR